jgi:hypothetical protein
LSCACAAFGFLSIDLTEIHGGARNAGGAELEDFAIEAQKEPRGGFKKARTEMKLSPIFVFLFLIMVAFWRF